MRKEKLKGRERRMRNSRGITLIALIITIVVLLILAVVAIRAVTGEGILQHAKNAQTEYQTAQGEENTTLQGYLNKIEENVPGGNTGGENENTTNPVFASITASNYGDEIKYSAGGVEEWKVFYKDDNYLYIITSDYLNNSLLPNSTTDTTLLNMSTSGTYGAYWTEPTKFRSTGSETITDNVANKYQLSWLAKNVDTDGTTRINNTNYNAQATGDLSNVAAWTSKFGDTSKGIEAIGAPTFEMWVASWNAKGALLGTDKYVKLYADSNASGYFVDDAENPVTNGSYSINVGTGTDGCKDTMYFPYTSATSNCGGYWLASPSAHSSGYVMSVVCTGDVCYGGFAGSGMAARPLVSIPSSLITTNADGTLAVAQ